ncbi:MAG: ribosomal-processing cysteine protease Prp [Tissierellia bacterium]|nr:ribosomal-processing cysteine protease Prp [Tissierellia bacterium]
MIDVEIKKTNTVIREMIIHNHAEFDIYGRDIVCAAVSALTLNTINTITHLLKYPLNYDMDEEQAVIQIHHDGISKDVNLILASLELGLQNIREVYPNHIGIHYKEV